MNCESDRFAVYSKIHSPSNDWNVAGERSGWTQLRLASVTCSLLNWSHCQRSSRAAVLLQTSPHTDLERLDSAENMADRITKLTGPYENSPRASLTVWSVQQRAFRTIQLDSIHNKIWFDSINDSILHSLSAFTGFFKCLVRGQITQQHVWLP